MIWVSNSFPYVTIATTESDYSKGPQNGWIQHSVKKEEPETEACQLYTPFDTVFATVKTRTWNQSFPHSRISQWNVNLS